jgi:hypothetical protein
VTESREKMEERAGTKNISSFPSSSLILELAVDLDADLARVATVTVDL